MIYVHAHPERMIFRKHCTQLGRDSLRKENRHTRADPQEFDVPDCTQSGQEFLEPVIAENQGVATTQKYVAYFGVRFEITERLLKIGVKFLFANPAHHSTTSAIAAVTRTPICYQEQDTIRVPMHQAWHRHVRIFA